MDPGNATVTQASIHDDVEEILLTEEQIQARVTELGQQLAADYEGRFPVLVSVLKGSIIFLADLLQYLRQPLLVVWDRLPAHRSKLVGEFLNSLDGQIAVEYLPPYAPELNPVEYLWGYWKHHQLPNVCPKDLWALNDRARQTLKRLRRRPRLITAFWKQSSLAFS